MDTSVDEDLKGRSAQYLKRMGEIAAGATRTAVISFAALAVIWFTQIRPQNRQLLNAYGQYQEIYTELQERDSLRKKLRYARDDKREMKDDPPPAVAPDDSPEQSDGIQQTLVRIEKEFDQRARDFNQKQIERLQSDIKKSNADLNAKGTELEALAKNVSFEVFGLKLPVPPLYTSAAWNILLLALIVYLARARSAVWTFCAGALLALKKLGRKPETLNDIAGSGPLWLAPPPSRPRESEAVTASDLRSAFGWNRLETLPSIAATTGFLLLGLLQLTVSAQGYEVIKAARDFTAQFDKVGSTGSVRSGEVNLQSLSEKIEPLTISSVEASLLSLFLLLTLGGTLILVVWWFRPWKIPDQPIGEAAAPQRLARLLLFTAALLSLCLLFGWLKPAWGVNLGVSLARVLPAVTRFLVGSVVAFCLIELLTLARFPAKVRGGNS